MGKKKTKMSQKLALAQPNQGQDAKKIPKVVSQPNQGQKKKTKKKSKTKKDPMNISPEQLKKAVLDLGGDEKDMDLLEEVPPTDDEILEEETEKNSEDFSLAARKELEAFIKNLGLDKKFQNVPDAEINEPDDESDAPDDDDDEEEESVDESEPEDQDQVQVGEVSSTTSNLPEESPKASQTQKSGPEFHFLKEKPERSHCVVKSNEKWFDMFDISEEDLANVSATPDYWMPKLEKFAGLLLELEVENHKAMKAKGAKRSEANWLQTVLQSGALGDKISAFSVMLQENPVHSLTALTNLIEMVSLKSRRPCMMAMEALTELLTNHLLPSDRKLKAFREQPFELLPKLSGGNKDTRDRYLIVWWFEHQLKVTYAQFLKALDDVSKDTIEKTKIQAMNTVLELLKSTPECEDELLTKLINKLGDPTRSIAAKAMHLLGKLLVVHPLMKGIVVKEVERLLYRPNVSPKAQYYGICFLSQVLLEEDELDLANKLIQIYFGFFKASVKKGEIDTKLMSALLTGVNRAFPYAKLESKLLEDQIQIMFRVVNLSAFNTSIQALMLLYQIMDHGESCTDRFYTTLYKKIQDPGFEMSSKQTMFLNLLYKAMKSDTSANRIRAFIKRLLQMCQYFSPHLVCGCLFLVSEVVRGRKDIHLHQRSHGLPANVMDKFEDDDYEEEHYEDVKEECDEEKSEEKPEGKPLSQTNSWVHVKNLKGHTIHRKSMGYDPNHRNPMYCGAEHSVMWELELLTQHFHPSVALFAQKILDQIQIKYSGDPLQDFTLMRFLDRFVFRNPKKEPLKGKPTTILAKRGKYMAQGIRSIAPDSKDYVQRDEATIPEDEKFLYKFFREKASKKTEEEDSDASSVTSEDFNKFMDTMANNMDGVDEDLQDLKALEDDEDSGDENEDNESKDDEEPKLDGEDSEDEANFEALEDMDDGEDSDDEFDEEGFGEEDSESEDEVQPKKMDKLTRMRKKFSVPKKGGDLSSLLASAEEFADMIDENQDDMDLGGSEAMSTITDRAGLKQLKWEKNRNNLQNSRSNWAKKSKTGGKTFKNKSVGLKNGFKSKSKGKRK